jgi:UDP-N-acetylglucosamine--N-acetylmuramyl-(pentapeptide) pyrophosphoryl-undecaprenol N-acetylglucosamine transferase
LIFLSLGTTKQPFMRAVDLMAPFVDAGENVLVQHGLTMPDNSRPGIAWVRFMEYAELIEAIRQSRAFFCHAGVGSVITSLMQDVTPIVIPRDSRFGEHVDDHQLDLASRLQERGLVAVLALGDKDAEAAVARACARRVQTGGRGQELFRAVSLIVNGPTRPRSAARA